MKLPIDEASVNGALGVSGPMVTVDNREPLQAEIRALRAEIDRLREAVRSTNAPELIDAETAADCLSISERTLRSYLSDETIQSIKIGRRRLIPVDALHDFVRSRLNG